jgi:hypothetical protein
MRTEDLFSGAVPMVVKLDIGMTEPEGVALEITYAQTDLKPDNLIGRCT